MYTPRCTCQPPGVLIGHIAHITINSTKNQDAQFDENPKKENPSTPHTTRSDKLEILWVTQHKNGWHAIMYAIFSARAIFNWKTKPHRMFPPDFKSGGNLACGFVHLSHLTFWLRPPNFWLMCACVRVHRGFPRGFNSNPLNCILQVQFNCNHPIFSCKTTIWEVISD